MKSFAFQYMKILILYLNQQQKKEAHGPHLSPEKTVQINTHMIISYIDKEKKKKHYQLYENLLVLYLNNLEFPSPKDALCQVRF